jgi:hypothetical protein
MLGASISREIDAAFATMVEKRTDALLVNPSPLYISRRVRIVSLARRDPNAEFWRPIRYGDLRKVAPV